MAARTLLDIFDKHNPAMQGKTKNLVWYNAQQKFMGIAVHESYEYAVVCAATRSLPDHRCKEISMAACGKAYDLPPLPKAGAYFGEGLDVVEKFSTSFDVSPSMEIVENPDYDSEESEIEARRLNPISGGSMTFSLGEGLLNFLYADFDACLTDAETQCEPEHQQINFQCVSEAEQQLFDYYCLEETVQRFLSVLWASVYTMVYSPFMRQRTKKELSEYNAYLKALQKKLSDYVEFIYDPALYSWEEIAKAMCQAELVHEVNIVVSFVPILFSVWFGALPVFVITSILAAGYDLLFVILQRYNRPRVLRLAMRKKPQSEKV